MTDGDTATWSLVRELSRADCLERLQRHGFVGREYLEVSGRVIPAH